MQKFVSFKLSDLYSLKDKAVLTNKDGGNVSTKPVQLVGLSFHNPNGSKAYIQIFDAEKTTDVALGTTKPIEPGFEIAANSSLRVFFDPNSHLLTRGLVAAATTAATGNTLVTTELIGRLYYRD